MKVGRDVLGMDLYRVLGLERTATPAEIRGAYRRLVRRSHPDLQPHSHTCAQRRMVELNIAASVLLDPDRRAEYDLGRERTARRGTTTPRARQRRAAPGWWVGVPRGSGVGQVDEDWVGSARRARRSRIDREIAPMLGRLRVWPARLMQALALETEAWSPRTHALFTFATVGLAFLLIAAARPRSLPGFEDDGQATRGQARIARSG